MSMALLGPSGRLTLEAPVYTLGSEPGNQLVLNDPKVSPRHAVLQLQGQQYSITDLGSFDGTYLNEQRLAPHMPAFLKHGDHVRVGNTFYTLEESLAAAPAYAPTMVASSSPAYDQTVQAAQAPAYGQVPQTPAYGQSNPAFPDSNQGPQVPAAPAYGQSNPAFPPYAQTPQPPVAPAYGQESQVPDAQVYGQSSPSYPAYPQGNVSSPSYPGYPAPGSADPYGAPTAAYAPAPGQPQQPWGAGMPPGYVPPAAPKKKSNLTVVIIILLIVLVLGGSGVGYGVYLATRPKPVITVTSPYNVGGVFAGSESTAFHLSGTDFTANSDITFLLDGAAAPGNTPAHSDSNGKVTATLTVTTDWTVGKYKITAKDAAGYVTALPVSVTIVAPGQAKTPGPKGAPTDTASGTIDTTVQVSGSSSSAITLNLKVTGGTDSGTVCRDVDNGQPHSVNLTTSSGDNFTETTVKTCSGTYKSGRLDYTETVTSDKIVFTSGQAKGLTCTAQTPYMYYHLEGSFTTATDINGTATGDSVTITCKLGSYTGKPIVEPAVTGTWTGIASMQ